MKKRSIFFIIYLIILAAFIFPVFSYADNDIPKVNTGIKIYDYAELLSIEQEKVLSEKANEILEKHNIDIAIVTVNTTNGLSSMEYADDFFDYNPFGYGEKATGLLMLINMEEREVWITTHGDAINIFTDYKIDSLLDKVYTGLSQADYYKAGSDFLSNSESYINRWEIAQIPLKERVGVLGILFLSLFWGFGIGGFITFLLFIFSKEKISKNPYIRTYLNDFKIIGQTDDFLSTNTVRNVIPKAPPVQRSSSGGVYKSSSRSSSTTHRSSSGRTHGGGGRKF